MLQWIMKQRLLNLAWLLGLSLLLALQVGCAALDEVLEEQSSGTAWEQGGNQGQGEAGAEAGRQELGPGEGQDSGAQQPDSASQLSAAFEALDDTNGELEEFRAVALHLLEYGKLPDYFITKSEARALGWVAQAGNLHEVAPGASIGGDGFQNREKLLPAAKGRKWYEADINYKGGTRGAERIVYSNDGLIYMTRDHYKTFLRIDGGEE